MTLVKACGLSRPEDVAAAAAAGADFAGFVVNFPASHRSVSLGRAKQLAAALPEGVRSVAVMVDQPPVVAAEALRAFDCVQLHGAEDDAYIAAVRRLAGIGPDEGRPRIVKAFRVRAEGDLFAAALSAADVVLLDAGMGGGTPFDHALVPADFPRPYVLAGGLAPETVGQAVRALRPWAVDVSSGVEKDKRKAPALMQAFVAAVRQADDEGGQR